MNRNDCGLSTRRGHMAAPLELMVTLLALFAGPVHSTEAAVLTAPPFFNGGMFFHAGAATVAIPDGTVNGLTLGLGGRAAILAYPRLRVGGMGFSTGFSHESLNALKGSYVSLRFGGATVEYLLTSAPVTLSAGFLLGGGSLHYLQIYETSGDRKLVSFEKQATAIAMPMVLVQYPLRGNLDLACMVDWIFGTRLGEGRSFGPRLHAGVLFKR